ncbi:hypothetical protein H0H87_008391 [Tephrocybe sp. NHM501043]|nr:hypothetical protein H0H87_008391 [Tephrocybe sp. NHM501043]
MEKCLYFGDSKAFAGTRETEFLDSCQAITEHLEHLKEHYDIQGAFKETFGSDLELVNKDLQAARTENLRLQRKMRECTAAHESEIESMKKQLEDTKQENARLRELVTSTANKLMVEGYCGVEDSKPDLKQEAPVAEPKLEA